MGEVLDENNPGKMPRVLITGGSGLIGRRLTRVLLMHGYKVSLLSRGSYHIDNARVFQWDPEKLKIDKEALLDVGYIIHLAGANLGEMRWTAKRKEEIIKSRVESARLLHEEIKRMGTKLNAFVSASGISYYGTKTTLRIFKEDDPPGNDFLSEVCKRWEAAADLFSDSASRVVKIRTAVVLEKNDSALSRLMEPARFGFLVKTGSGEQYMPWIHIDDICRIYLDMVRDQTKSGVFNAAAPDFVNHKEFMKTLSGVMKKPLFPVSAPAIALKAVLGEMSEVILEGSRISSEKLISSGYKFRYINLEDALREILNRY